MCSKLFHPFGAKKKGLGTNLLAFSSLSWLSCFARSMTCVLNLGLESRSFNA